MVNKDYFKKLGITKEPYYNDTEFSYTVELEDSNEFSRVYTLLDNADWLSLVSGDLSLKEEESVLMYEDNEGKVLFILDANFATNKYTLKLEEE